MRVHNRFEKTREIGAERQFGKKCDPDFRF